MSEAEKHLKNLIPIHDKKREITPQNGHKMKAFKYSESYLL